ncbi:MAG: BrnA antitoxin family protein [Candidatus Bipolaricaulota bacterium]|nr:BrnA antitoxin family protein [Candidatus Bipolaricaulota bacterium]MCS7274874.1 BrnA antitoxin family protein [Candidatus Bipolaricaulota bacterium]MDW8111153.1 CopG family antitoxin [Candidatus Bipolaricaulota bacterium]MDW8329587.1 CopG family antitoxin [Candidatus Bipolaricaulota bacterium]
MSKMKRKPKELPDMTDWSDQQIHDFWKNHDSADYWEETVPVEVTTARRRRQVVPVPLDRSDLISLRKLARRLGTDPTVLIRRWIKEKLQAATL